MNVLIAAAILDLATVRLTLAPLLAAKDDSESMTEFERLVSKVRTSRAAT